MASKNKRNQMEKCKTCVNLDRIRSNENWVVCPMIPLEIMAGKSADECTKYIPLIPAKDSRLSAWMGDGKTGEER